MSPPLPSSPIPWKVHESSAVTTATGPRVPTLACSRSCIVHADVLLVLPPRASSRAAWSMRSLSSESAQLDETAHIWSIEHQPLHALYFRCCEIVDKQHMPCLSWRELVFCTSSYLPAICSRAESEGIRGRSDLMRPDYAESHPHLCVSCCWPQLPCGDPTLAHVRNTTNSLHRHLAR